MAEASGSSCGSGVKINLKRKRDSTDDDLLESMPPAKISLSLEEELKDQPAHNVVIESSPCTSDEEVEQPQSVTPSEYTDNWWSPTSNTDYSIDILSPEEQVTKGECTPHSNKRPSATERRGARCPLPEMRWAEAGAVWRGMCADDARAAAARAPNLFDHHPMLQPRMRAILLDWINEVCDVYKLRRETYHLTAEYFDRYLTRTTDMLKSRLQLIGITCLFIAAKVEEIYPPKVSEFAYVTDSACTVDEILHEEILILKILSWDITPLTTNGWVNMYLQLANEGRNSRRYFLSEDKQVKDYSDYTFVFAQYSSLDCVMCGQLIDLAILHVQVNKFQYSVVAAAAVAHVLDKATAMRVSGYEWEDIAACYRWLAPSWAAVKAGAAHGVVRRAHSEYLLSAAAQRAICPELNADESHLIQAHDVTLDMFDKVCQVLEQQNAAIEETTVASDVTHILPLTPPQSDEKNPTTPTTKTPSATR